MSPGHDAPPLLIGVLGPTASGKTDLAEALAAELGAQLVNADAFQVYRGFDIGTGKSPHRARYELLDFKDPWETFGVGEFVIEALKVLDRCFPEGRSVIVVGGTGLYVRALLEEYTDMASVPDPGLRTRLDALGHEERLRQLRSVAPEVTATIDTNNPVRVQRALERALNPGPSLQWRLPPFEKRKFAIVPSASETESRVSRRVEAMVQNGWVSEVAELRSGGVRWDDPAMRAIGYRTLWRHLDGEIGLEEAAATTIAETRRYAKRQRTWLRSEPNLVELDLDNPLGEARASLGLV